MYGHCVVERACVHMLSLNGNRCRDIEICTSACRSLGRQAVLWDVRDRGIGNLSSTDDAVNPCRNVLNGKLGPNGPKSDTMFSHRRIRDNLGGNDLPSLTQFTRTGQTRGFKRPAVLYRFLIHILLQKRLRL
jgi:hypothetical protein